MGQGEVPGKSGWQQSYQRSLVRFTRNFHRKSGQIAKGLSDVGR